MVPVGLGQPALPCYGGLFPHVPHSPHEELRKSLRLRRTRWQSRPIRLIEKILSDQP